MKTIYLTAIVIAAVAIALVLLYQNHQPTQEAAPEATTSTTEPSTTSTTSTITTTTTSTPTTSSTTTTLPRYLLLESGGVGKCKESVLGMMNLLYADIPETIEGRWSTEPTRAVTIKCDGVDIQSPDRMVYRGGNTVGLGNEIAGSYRLMIRCGHNTPFEDLRDCRNITVYLDTWSVYTLISNLTDRNP